MTGLDLPYEPLGSPEVLLSPEPTVSESIDLPMGLLLRWRLA